MVINPSFKMAGRIAEVAGLPAALTLCAFAGKAAQRVYFPKSAEGNHLFKKLLGVEAFSRLVDAFGGQYVEVPELDLLPLRRVGMVYRLTNRGLPVGDIAQAVGINVRRVQAIRTQLRQDGFADLGNTLQVDEVAETDSEGGDHD